MKRNMTITIKRRTLTDGLVLFMVFYPFCLGTLNDLLGFPYAVRYVLDLAWIGSLVLLFLKKHYEGGKRFSKLAVWTILFLLYTGFAYIVNFQSPLYYLWGLRNNFRFYVAFFAFTAFLKSEDAENCLKIFDGLFWINVVASLIQYFVFGIERDYLGGIFGVQSGVNGYTNLFFLIALTRSAVLYLEKRESTAMCACKCVAALFVAALAELKFFFVEFLLIIALAVLFTNFTWRKLFLILGSIAAVFVGAALLVVFFPSYAGWFTLEYMLDVVTSERGYTSSGDLNRLTAIFSINDLWLKNWGQQLFGLGLGNCDTSGFAFLNTPFFRRYGDMHYSWISHAFMYLECGWIGLLFYWGFFVQVYFKIKNIEKHCPAAMASYCRIARIMAVLCCVVTFYNASLRAEGGYMAYFIMAIPFALGRQMQQKFLQ